MEFARFKNSKHSTLNFLTCKTLGKILRVIKVKKKINICKVVQINTTVWSKDKIC